MFISPQASRLPSAPATIRGTIPWVFPTKALSGVLTNTSTDVLHGSVDASGNITYSNITTQANNFTADDVPLFDGVNPSSDRLCIAIGANDNLASIDLYISRAGVYTGTANATIKYRNSSDTWITVNAGTIDLRTTGVKEITSIINYDQIGFTDNPLDQTLPQMKCVFVFFTGITAVTTAPLASRVWIKRQTGSNILYTNFTSLALGTFAPYMSLSVLPRMNDITIFSFDAPFSVLRTTITRSRTSSWATELIYSKSDGTFGVIPTSNVIKLQSSLSANGGDELFTSTTTATVLYDTFNIPSDWASITIDGTLGYWMGWRYTANGASPELTLLATIEAQIYSGASTGVRAGETTTYTSFDSVFDQTSPSATTLVVVNDRTKQRISATIPANTSIATPQTTSFSVQNEDEILIQVLTSDPLVTPADGYIKLS